jgi:bifunctional non-homologous end joining protein LigD
LWATRRPNRKANSYASNNSCSRTRFFGDANSEPNTGVGSDNYAHGNTYSESNTHCDGHVCRYTSFKSLHHASTDSYSAFPVTSPSSSPQAKFKPVKSLSARLAAFVEPMKAKLVDSMRPGDWIYEIKFDGHRALALRGGSKTRVLSRNPKDLDSKFAEVEDAIGALDVQDAIGALDVQDAIGALDVQDAIIDGEIVALDEKGRSSFQALQGLDMGEKRPPIVYYAFDLLRFNGKNLQNSPIEERKAKLEKLLKKPSGVIRYSVSFVKDIEELLDPGSGFGARGPDRQTQRL